MRDQKVTRQLHEHGWRVLRVWEHELKDKTRLAARLQRLLKVRELHGKYKGVALLSALQEEKRIERTR